MKLAILAPGHFHATLLQKQMYADVDSTVHVYAEPGPDLDDYVRKIESYNERADNPTSWHLQTYTGADFMEKFIAEGKADIAVISGNNQHKTRWLTRAIGAGVHTLADKPMAIDEAGFTALENAFVIAARNKVLLYDIMTERHEITSMLQRAFSTIPSVFGNLENGSVDNPAVVKESVHHFSKVVSGAPIRRPAWFFDVAQQGEGLVDITTHLVDLVQWACFPEQTLDYRRDVRIIAAKRWPTVLTPAQFTQVTQVHPFPAFLHKDVHPDGTMHAYANGEISYTIKGVHAKVSVMWNFEAPPGGSDTHFSVMRGSAADLVIRQGEAEGYIPVLTIEPVGGVDPAGFEAALRAALPSVHSDFPGVYIARSPSGWQVVVPATYHVGHEAHFGQVTEQFLDYVETGALPAWEVPNMLAKYYTTTTALALAHRQ